MRSAAAASHVGSLAVKVVAASHEAASASGYLKAAATLLMGAVPVDALLAIRQPAEGAWVAEYKHGVSHATLKRLRAGWPLYRKELSPVFESAARAGAAVDSHALGDSFRTTRYYAEIAAPQHARATAIVLLRWQTTVLGAFVLGRRGEFTEYESELAGALAPVLALGLAAHLRPHRKSPQHVPVMTASEREVVSYVCLGFTNKEIALACGISPHRVRNKLVRIFERWGVSTRAELAGIAARTCVDDS